MYTFKFGGIVQPVSRSLTKDSGSIVTIQVKPFIEALYIASGSHYICTMHMHLGQEEVAPHLRGALS